MGKCEIVGIEQLFWSCDMMVSHINFFFLLFTICKIHFYILLCRIDDLNVDCQPLVLVKRSTVFRYSGFSRRIIWFDGITNKHNHSISRYMFFIHCMTLAYFWKSIMLKAFKSCYDKAINYDSTLFLGLKSVSWSCDSFVWTVCCLYNLKSCWRTRSSGSTQTCGVYVALKGQTTFKIQVLI